MQKITALISVVLLLFSSRGFAQKDSTCTLTISGTVTDLSTKERLGYASIFVKESPGLSTQTDDQGKYTIRGLCPGRYTIVVSHLNCERTTDTIEVSQSMTVNFRMPHHEHEGPIVVITDRAENPVITIPRMDISGRKLDQTRGKPLGLVLGSVNGVTVLQSGTGVAKPMIHGLHSNRVLILNNGVRQEGQQWGLEHAPEIDPFVASRITVIKGANAVRYGSDAIGGVILVDPAYMRDSSGFGGEINLVGFSNNREGNVSAMVEQNPQRLPSLSWRLQGTFRRGGNYRTPDYWMKNTGVSEKDFSAAAMWKKERYSLDVFYSQFNTDIGIFSGSHIGNITDLYRAFDSPVPLDSSGFSYEIGRPYQHVEHELTRVRGTLQIGERWKLYSIIGRQYDQRGEYDKHRPLNDSLATLNRPELQYEVTTFTGEIVAEHKMIKRFAGSIGISGVQQKNTYEGRFFIPNYRSHGAGAWWIERWMGDSILILEAGLRYDYKFLQSFMWQNNVIVKPVREFHNLAGTAGAIVRMNERLQFTVNLGRAWRAPSVNELYSKGLHHGAASVEIGDANLRSETCWSGSISAHWHEHDKLNVEVTGYYHYFTGFIYLNPVMPPTVTIRGAFPTFRYEQADATLKGIDYSVLYHFNEHWNAFVSGSLLRAWNRTANDWLILMPSDRVAAGMGYEIEKFGAFENCYAEVKYQFVNKQFRVPFNSDFVAPPPAYSLAGIEAGTGFTAFGQPAQIGVSVTNILNTSYREYLNRFRYYTDEAGINVRLHLKFTFNYSKTSKK